MSGAECARFRRNAAPCAIIAALAAALPLAAFPGKTPENPLQAPEKPPWLLSVAVKLHMKAVKGDRQAARDGRRMLEDLASVDPNNPEVTAYLGSSYLLAASMALTPWVKWTYARKGLSLLDSAVESEPADPRMRFLRGVSTMNLPVWFGRSSQSASDISAVAENASADFAAGKLPSDMAAYALYLEGQARLARGDAAGAKHAWKEATELGVFDEYAEKSAKELEKLGAKPALSRARDGEGVPRRDAEAGATER